MKLSSEYGRMPKEKANMHTYTKSYVCIKIVQMIV